MFGMKMPNSEDMSTMKKPELIDDDENSYVQFCNNEFSRYSQQRYSLEANWFTVISMTLGLQNTRWNAQTRNFETPRVKPGRVRLIANKMEGFQAKMLAKMTKTPPTMYVQPSSASDEDIANAKLSEAIIEHYKRKLKFGRLRDQMATWALLCGSSFIHAVWDPEAGECCPGVDNVRMGDLRLDVLSSFNIFADVSTPGIDHLDRFIKATVVPVDYIWRKYHVAVPAEYINESSFFFLNRISNIQNQKIIPTNSDVQRGDVVILKEMWIKPNAEFPKGQVITTAGKKLLKDPIPIPNETGEFGLFKFDDIQVPGRFYGQSKHEHAVPIQRERNKIISQIVEARNVTGRGKWAFEKGTGLKKSNISSLVEEIIEYRAGGKPPQFVHPPSIPGYVIQEIERCDRDLMESYQQGLQPDYVPPGVSSGRAIGYLQEENDSTFGPALRQWEDNYAELWRFSLRLLKENVLDGEKRKLPIIEGRTVLELKEFSGKDIRETDVKVEAGSSLPQSKTATQLIIKENWQSGVYGEPQDPMVLKHVRKIMGVGIDDEMRTDEDVEKDNGLKEAMMAQKGKFDTPMPFDIHEIRIAVMERFARERRYSLTQKQMMNIMEAIRRREQYIREDMEMAEEEAQETGDMSQLPDGGQSMMGIPPAAMDAGVGGPMQPGEMGKVINMPKRPMSEVKEMIPGAEKLPPHKIQELMR